MTASLEKETSNVNKYLLNRKQEPIFWRLETDRLLDKIEKMLGCPEVELSLWEFRDNKPQKPGGL